MRHLLLFESHNVYDKSLHDSYWKDISKKFPDYNNPNSQDFKDAVEYIYDNMKKKYPNEDWDKISGDIKNSIRGGIS